MSARKSSRTTEWPGATPAQPQPPSQPPTQPPVKPLVLEPGAVSVSKNGIEFRSEQPIPTWTELTVSLVPPHSIERITCTGVVVGCTGNRHLGYVISLLFSGLTPHAARQLGHLARDSARL